jgi:hypothetical protein
MKHFRNSRASEFGLTSRCFFGGACVCGGGAQGSFTLDSATQVAEVAEEDAGLQLGAAHAFVMEIRSTDQSIRLAAADAVERLRWVAAVRALVGLPPENFKEPFETPVEFQAPY